MLPVFPVISVRIVNYMNKNFIIQFRNIKIRQNGFTLMEMLVATSIFVLVAVSSLSIYTAALRASQKTTALVRIQQETQLIMGLLAKKIRTSLVDYDYTGYNTPLVNPEDKLALIDLLGDTYVFKKSGDTLTVSINDSEDKIILADYVTLDDLDFYISPTTNPFASLDEPPSSNPYVTIVMSVSSVKGQQIASLILQQTVPQRSGGR